MADTVGFLSSCNRVHFAAACPPQGKPASKEEVFFWSVRECLLAVAKDREAMTWKVRNLLRERGRSYNAIMSAEWYNLSEVEPNADNLVPPQHNRLLPPPPTHCPSSPIAPSPITHHPLSPLPSSQSLAPSIVGHSPSSHASTRYSSAQVQVTTGKRQRQFCSLNNWLRTGQMPRRDEGEGKWHMENQLSYGSNCGPSDSGVGTDTLATNNSPTVANSNRLHAYIHQQNMVAAHLAERDRSAQVAAITLMSNSPHPEELNRDDNFNGTSVLQMTQRTDSKNQQ